MAEYGILISNLFGLGQGFIGGLFNLAFTSIVIGPLAIPTPVFLVALLLLVLVLIARH